MTSAGRKKIIGMYPVDMLLELQRNREITIDTRGRTRGFVDFVERMYRNNKRS